MSVCV